ncbi:hypothetical protein DKG74_07035 [Zavarzinia aquatilis]|uniref:Uncharacterized protein n=1 Tax=Zavarzinia aquatilis TaxID=2211142 RepID=A0A317ED78_9PROT|nr:hypothetical protein DKG74_07035 [Zavarzinia aquatilis]
MKGLSLLDVGELARGEIDTPVRAALMTAVLAAARSYRLSHRGCLRFPRRIRRALARLDMSAPLTECEIEGIAGLCGCRVELRLVPVSPMDRGGIGDV